MNYAVSPLEYAIDLYNQFYGIPLYQKAVKECCFIAVREMRKVAEVSALEYLSEVEEEIKKL